MIINISKQDILKEELEKSLFNVISKHSKTGLDKKHTVAGLKWVLGSVERS